MSSFSVMAIQCCTLLGSGGGGGITFPSGPSLIASARTLPRLADLPWAHWMNGCRCTLPSDINATIYSSLIGNALWLAAIAPLRSLRKDFAISYASSADDAASSVFERRIGPAAVSTTQESKGGLSECCQSSRLNCPLLNAAPHPTRDGSMSQSCIQRSFGADRKAIPGACKQMRSA